MDQSDEMSSESKEALKDVVNESLGNPESVSEHAKESAETSHEDLPAYAKQRLGMQEKRHKKEMRRLQQEMAEMKSHFNANTSPSESQQYGLNASTGQPQAGGGEDQIHRAVAMALHARDERERQAKEAEKMQHVHKQYQALQDHLDNASSKYEDFDDVVKSPDARFTEHMRDAGLLIPNADDVFYKLGKNRDELKRISELHPLEQAREIIKMSIALNNGQGSKASSPKTLGQVKNNPASNAQSLNENTPVSELRKRMKAGWK